MTELNSDVLLLICGLLTEVQDVLSFSLTCSALHPVAVERRLSMRPVTINSAKSVHDLYDFIFVDEKQRGKHIRAITIPFHDDSPNSSDELLDRLVAIFESAPRIHALSLCIPSHESQPRSLFRHPGFLAAVTTDVASLQELEVVGALDTARTLFNLRSALKTFRCSETYEYSRSIPWRPCMAPPTDTLVEIELSLNFLGLTGRNHVTFPAVRSLTLTRVYDVRLRLDIFLIQFPSLDRAFIINDANPVHANDRPVVACRERNRELVRKRNMLPWKALDRVVASPDILYSLGLDCPIRHLTLGMQWNDIHDCRASADSVRAVLREHAPTHLALVGIRLPHGFSNLGDVLQPEESSACRITHLFLDAMYRNTNMPYDPIRGTYGTTDSPESWDAMLNALLGGLEGLHLTHIRVVLSCQVNFEHSFCAPIYDSARSFKFDRFVATLTSTIPSLTHISITSAGRSYKYLEAEGKFLGELGTWETSRAWRARRLSDDSGAHRTEMQDLEELSAEEAEAMIDTEELHATERKKVRSPF